MKKIIRPLLILLVLGAAGVATFLLHEPPPDEPDPHRHRHDQRRRSSAPQIAGQIGQLLVNEGDVVKKDQLVAVIMPDELRADIAYYAAQRRGPRLAGQRERGRAALPGAADDRSDPPGRSRRSPPPEAQRGRGVADLENARLVFERTQRPVAEGRRARCRMLDQARTALDAAQARSSTRSRSRWTRSARRRAGARSNAEQVSVRRSQVAVEPGTAGRRQRPAHARPTCASPTPRLHAPIDGIVDVRARAHGRGASTPGQPVVTLDQPRRSVGAGRRRGDLHRSRAHRRHADGPPALGRRSARARCSTAASTPAFATQRDVSRTKRDIKTFEVRAARGQHATAGSAVGMTAYVVLPAGAA